MFIINDKQSLEIGNVKSKCSNVLKKMYTARDDHRNIHPAGYSPVGFQFMLFAANEREASLISSQARESMFIAAPREYLDCIALFV